MTAALGFRQVLHFDSRFLRLAADGWRRLAQRFRDRADEVTRLQAQMTAHWQGAAAQAAQVEARRVHEAVQAIWCPLSGQEEVLTQVADAGDRLRERAHELVRRARSAGVAIDDDGRVHPAAGVDPGSASRAVAHYRWEVAQLVAEASQLDREAARQLAQHAPWRPGMRLGFVSEAMLPQLGTPAAEVADWWASLDPDQHRYLLLTRPELIGSLDGIPVDVRDAANRLLLDRERAELEALLAEFALHGQLRRRTPSAFEWWRAALDVWEWQPVVMALRWSDPDHRRRMAFERGRDRLATLDRLTEHLAATERDGHRVYLLAVDTAGDGAIVAALGNPDWADYVLTLVPGTGNDLSNTGGSLRRTARLADRAHALDPTSSTAVVHWLDYDAPEWTLFGNGPHRSRAADQGAPVLRRYAEGLRETHVLDGAEHTVLGHSYGSVVVGVAAAKGLSADRLIFIGSPGVKADHVTQLTIDSDPTAHVWAAMTPDDEIRFVPDPFPHGHHPTDKKFGARVFTAGPGGHGAYFNPSNPAFDNMVHITQGRYDTVERPFPAEARSIRRITRP